MNAKNQPGKARRAILFSAVALVPMLLKGDVLEMNNGDRYAGSVVSVTQTNVTFQSEIQGKLILPRNKVAGISFREPVARAPMAAPTVAPLNLKTNAATKLDFDSKSLAQVQRDLLSSASPEARRQFDETIKGLMTGRLTVDDIRVQARNSVKQIRAAKEELGEDAGGVLDGYLNILEHFLAEADKPTVATPLEKPKATNSISTPTPQK